MKVTDRLLGSVQTVFGTCNENYCGELYPSLRLAPQIGIVTKTTSDLLKEACQCAGCLKALRFWCREPWHFHGGSVAGISKRATPIRVSAMP